MLYKLLNRYRSTLIPVLIVLLLSFHSTLNAQKECDCPEYDELIKNDDLYAELFNLQAKGYQ